MTIIKHFFLISLIFFTLIPLGALPVKLRFSPPKIDLNKQLSTNTNTTHLLAMKGKVTAKPFLNIKLYKYSKHYGSGYFRIVLAPNKEANRFKKIDKNIIFFVDVSASIVKNQLAEFVKGITSSLPKLNQNDQFEIVAFSNKPSPLFGKFEKPTKANIKKATSFLANLQATGSTNLYKTIIPYIRGKNTSKRALIIFILTDGKFNSGEIVEQQKLIHTITKNNQQKASIFIFTNTKKPNTLLLNSLALRNNGEYIKAKTIESSSKMLQEAITSTSNIVLGNLSYDISKDLRPTTFPQKLSYLILNHPIAIYGRYAIHTKNISLRIIGTGKAGNQYELMYKKNIEETTKGSKDIPQKWAKQYILHLYSKLTPHNSEKIKQKIYSIARKYSIPRM